MGDEYVLIDKDSFELLRQDHQKLGNVTGADINTPTSLGFRPQTRPKSSRSGGIVDEFPARITGGSVGAGFTFIEQLELPAGQTEDLVGGRTSDIDVAYEFNLKSVDVDDIVLIKQLPGPLFYFNAPLPTPQYEYEVYQGGPNNTAIFDMLRCHPQLPA
jgi:hypothetical protein